MCNLVPCGRSPFLTSHCARSGDGYRGRRSEWQRRARSPSYTHTLSIACPTRFVSVPRKTTNTVAFSSGHMRLKISWRRNKVLIRPRGPTGRRRKSQCSNPREELVQDIGDSFGRRLGKDTVGKNTSTNRSMRVPFAILPFVWPPRSSIALSTAAWFAPHQGRPRPDRRVTLYGRDQCLRRVIRRSTMLYAIELHQDRQALQYPDS